MAGIERLRREVRDLEKQAKGVFIPSLGFGPDEHVTEAEMKGLYNEVKEALSHYERERSDSSLAELHDAITRMQSRHLFVRADGAREEALRMFQETKAFKALQERIAGVDYGKATISKEDALHLAELSWGLPGSPRATPEYNGTLRFNGNHIEVVTSNVQQNPMFAMVSLKPIAEGGSHGWWHTHPMHADQERPSRSDVDSTLRSRIPLVTALMGKDGRPHVYVTSPKGKSHKVRQI